MLTPDRKLGYTVAVYGTQGDRVTEFWVFDMADEERSSTGDSSLAVPAWPSA